MPLLLNRDYCSNDSAINDWLQINWELLVERKVLRINEYLEFYGEGADFFGRSCRMTDIDASPTHFIKVEILNTGAIDILNDQALKDISFKLNRLVSFKDGFYLTSPPFDYVLVNDEKTYDERVFGLNNVLFRKELIKTI